MEDADTLWGRPQADGGRGGRLRGGERNGAGGRVSLRFGERGWSFWQDEVVGAGGAVLAAMGVFQEKDEVVDFVGWPPAWLSLSGEDHPPDVGAGEAAPGLRPECPQVTPASLWASSPPFGVGIPNSVVRTL